MKGLVSFNLSGTLYYTINRTGSAFNITGYTSLRKGLQVKIHPARPDKDYLTTALLLPLELL